MYYALENILTAFGSMSKKQKANQFRYIKNGLLFATSEMYLR
jgi:hypothetical protein